MSVETKSSLPTTTNTPNLTYPHTLISPYPFFPSFILVSLIHVLFLCSFFLCFFTFRFSFSSLCLSFLFIHHYLFLHSTPTSAFLSNHYHIIQFTLYSPYSLSLPYYFTLVSPLFRFFILTFLSPLYLPLNLLSLPLQYFPPLPCLPFIVHRHCASPFLV